MSNPEEYRRLAFQAKVNKARLEHHLRLHRYEHTYGMPASLMGPIPGQQVSTSSYAASSSASSGPVVTAADYLDFEDDKKKKFGCEDDDKKKKKFDDDDDKKKKDDFDKLWDGDDDKKKKDGEVLDDDFDYTKDDEAKKDDFDYLKDEMDLKKCAAMAAFDAFDDDKKKKKFDDGFGGDIPMAVAVGGQGGASASCVPATDSHTVTTTTVSGGSQSSYRPNSELSQLFREYELAKYQAKVSEARFRADQANYEFHKRKAMSALKVSLLCGSSPASQPTTVNRTACQSSCPPSRSVPRAAPPLPYARAVATAETFSPQVLKAMEQSELEKVLDESEYEAKQNEAHLPSADIFDDVDEVPLSLDNEEPNENESSTDEDDLGEGSSSHVDAEETQEQQQDDEDNDNDGDEDATD